MKALVIGATGATGQALLPLLITEIGRAHV